MTSNRHQPPTSGAPPSLDPASQVDIDDLDLARVRFRGLYTDALIQLPSGQPHFHWRTAQATLGPIVVTQDSLPNGVLLATRECEERNVLLIVHAGGSTMRHRDAHGTITPGRTGAIFSLSYPANLEVPPGGRHQAFILDPQVLGEHWRKLTGAESRGPLLFAPLFSLSDDGGAHLARLAAFINGELEHPRGLAATPLLARNLAEALLTTLLEVVPHNQTSLLERATPAITPACVRRAEAYMDAHTAEPITITDVATATGVSVRALQSTFRRFRDSSPHEYLKARRLELARARLLAPEPDVTVAMIARLAGYRHIGYFIAAYRHRFGETPGETLQRILGPFR
ncbi:MAG TPA: AraC family transcriptional regulator [Polyangia bacterium]|jgi:AraC-like DNA-binding protein|nr:AraC family transcriptional regulator [Polyangia bacterium]